MLTMLGFEAKVCGLRYEPGSGYYGTAALAFSVAVLLAIGQGSSLNFAGLVQDVFLVHDFTTHMVEINGPMWSIAVEVQIYLLFPLLIWLMRRTSSTACCS
ncbi:MAG: hypothetical protein ACJ746_12765 [Bryobacteraceae bacterium]